MQYHPKEFWKFAGKAGGWKEKKGAQEGVQPIRDEEGNMLTEPKAICAAVGRHYGRLAADPTGHSKHRGYWACRTDEWGLPHITEIDVDITMEELYMATMHLKNNKAPGEDGVIAEWVKK
jgi:hypothetical protein